MTRFEEEWKKFLGRMALDERRMPPDQIRMMKQAFMGGCGCTLIILREESPNDEDEAVEWLKGLWKEISEYWEGEIGRKN